MKLFFVIFLFCLVISSIASKASKPNIILFVADDLGWNDVSYHDPVHQIPTPNIDALGMNGLILNRHYSMHLCTPSRAALMTGEYPIRLGMQNNAIGNDEPWGLPLNRKIMPQYFKNAGYETYMVGKWHLGFHKKEFTPLERGFDHHYGYYGSNIDYFTKENTNPPFAAGVDFRDEWNVVKENETYVTEALTQAAVKYIKSHDKEKPLFMIVNHLAPHTADTIFNLLQAPQDEIDKFNFISRPRRQIYAAMISLVDKSIGNVMSELNSYDMLDNSVVIFFSDNGGPNRGFTGNTASNYPLRGQKNYPWEGSIRTPAVIWSPLIKNPHRVSNDLFHITDWLPTLMNVAGIDQSKIDRKIDGVDQWLTLTEHQPSNRTELLVNIETAIPWKAIIKDNWKLVVQDALLFDGWLSNANIDTSLTNQSYAQEVLNSQVNNVLNSTLTAKDILRLSDESFLRCPEQGSNDILCDPIPGRCLFDIVKDPCERFDRASEFPEIVNELEQMLAKYETETVSAINEGPDPMSDPGLYDDVWTFWNSLKIKK